MLITCWMLICWTSFFSWLRHLPRLEQALVFLLPVICGNMYHLWQGLHRWRLNRKTHLAACLVWRVTLDILAEQKSRLCHMACSRPSQWPVVLTCDLWPVVALRARVNLPICNVARMPPYLYLPLPAGQWACCAEKVFLLCKSQSALKPLSYVGGGGGVWLAQGVVEGGVTTK